MDLIIFLSVNVGEDCPVFDGLYEFCQISTGGSVGMALSTMEEAVRVVVFYAKSLTRRIQRI